MLISMDAHSILITHSRDAACKLKSRGQRIDLRDSWVTEPPHNGPQMQEL